MIRKRMDYEVKNYMTVSVSDDKKRKDKVKCKMIDNFITDTFTNAKNCENGFFDFKKIVPNIIPDDAPDNITYGEFLESIWSTPWGPLDCESYKTDNGETLVIIFKTFDSAPDKVYEALNKKFPEYNFEIYYEYMDKFYDCRGRYIINKNMIRKCLNSPDYIEMDVSDKMKEIIEKNKKE